MIGLVLGLAVISGSQVAAQPNGGIHLPMYRTVTSLSHKRSSMMSAAGLGDFMDVTYTVSVTMGDTETTLVLDTGSSDLWVVSDACSGECTDSVVPLYSIASLNDTGLDVLLLYGDSRTGTYASGPIGQETVGIGSLSVASQTFAAVNSTNTTIFATGSAGILGLGFPPISLMWRERLQMDIVSSQSSLSKRGIPGPSANISTGSIGQPPFPSFEFLKPAMLKKRQASDGTSQSPADIAISSFAHYGPLLTRLIQQDILDLPLVATTLQRDTFQIGGNAGMLSIGGLPAGLQTSQLTWVPVRGYSKDEGGLPPPSNSPNEVYPLVWEVAVDDVYFNGVKLPRSMLASPAVSLSALVDTGNSLIRGPRDVVDHIMAYFDGPDASFDCKEAHNLTFQIGGAMFTVDPRDFAHPLQNDSGSDSPRCTPALAVTDPPGQGGFLYSWSLGDPFLKSALVAYHYGNITNPSQDPPKVGLLSTVPSDVANQLQQAIQDVLASGGQFPTVAEPAPTGTAISSRTAVNGVPQATHSDLPSLASSAFTSALSPKAWTSLALAAATGLVLLGITYL
ncbi:aspartic peptidase domain-containing protein [Fomitopsis serialis]|uniref:aspartic peptidase domain-containing protein n=1 Tax=Fomitopsis serialis TaxID=139415 RepID=UPI00200894C1|nr:aspartic peptidase domain-containing protein [Neoantrodia serialis]KAH9923808.1 aspartic peptidase domain-containing protein [Neoantrodia serialis]